MRGLGNKRERMGRVKSGNMYKGPRVKDNGGERIESGRWGWVWWGTVMGVKGTTVIEQ